MAESTRTDIATLGEFGLIDRLASKFTNKVNTTLKGIGDDAAVIDIGNNRVMLISTDMLVERIHFDLTYTPLHHLGYKAISVNVSDIAAMNAIAQQVTVSIAISNRFSLEAVEELYRGIHAACEDYNVDLVGGDTTSSVMGLEISVTVIGQADKDKVVYRNGAKIGDIICLSGDIGGAYTGLNLLEREKQVFQVDPNMQPKLEGKDYVVHRLLKPQARQDVVFDLADLNIVPTSMIDVSDGLASELMHICTQSGVGANILEENLPISGETYETLIEFNMDPTTGALNGGEDYELLFTISPEKYELIKNHPDIAMIGVIKDKKDGLTLISKKGNPYPIQAQGWKHF
jgi:thiamine-monophosphate kinase